MSQTFNSLRLASVFALTIVATVSFNSASFAKQINSTGSLSTLSSCIQKKIEACKTDPTVRDKRACTSSSMKHRYMIICGMFPNRISSQSGNNLRNGSSYKAR